MWFPRFYSLFSCALGAMCLTAYQACADETSTGSTNQPALRTSIRSEELIDATNAKPIQRAFFSVGTNQFAFVVPEDYKLDAAQPGKIILTSPDYTCFITVQVVNPRPGDAAEPGVESFRSLALEEFPQGTIIREFGLRAANHSGPAYELHWKNSNDAQQMACVGFVPSGSVGVLKFSLLSNLDKYPQNQTSFRCLLRSFQSNERGKLIILPVSGAS